MPLINECTKTCLVCAGGWNQEPEKVKVAPKIPNEIPTADHPGDGRVRGSFRQNLAMWNTKPLSRLKSWCALRPSSHCVAPAPSPEDRSDPERRFAPPFPVDISSAKHLLKQVPAQPQEVCAQLVFKHFAGINAVHAAGGPSGRSS